MMKKIILFLTLVILGMGIAAAQTKGSHTPDPKKLKELIDYKVKFLAQEMELKDDQKQKFAELYAQLSEEKRKNFETMRGMEKKLKGDASEAEYKQLSDKINDCKLRDLQIDKEYDAKFSKFLSQKQIYKMKEAEETFRRKMVDMHHKRKHERKGKSGK